MERLSTKKIVTAALFAALACVATMSVRIPTPGTGGYIHPGDAIVILCGVFLDPATAFLAAGIGSGMADLLGGYFIYVPITFMIKGLVAYLSSRIFHGFTNHGKASFMAVAVCGVTDMLMVAGGYWLCECFLYGFGAALASVLSNLVQGFGGLVIACALYPLLRRPLSFALRS